MACGFGEIGRYQKAVIKRCLMICVLCCADAAGIHAADDAFSGRVAVELVDDIEFDHRLRLLEDFSFRDEHGRLWVARKGGLVDGIPALAGGTSWVRLPYAGKLRKASVLHDYFVAAKTEPWREVHRMYFAANLAEGVSVPEAKIVHMLTYASGWRWEPLGSSCYRGCHSAASMLAWRPALDTEKLRPLVDWIWSSAPELDEIERRTDPLIREPGPHIFSQGY